MSASLGQTRSRRRTRAAQGREAHQSQKDSRWGAERQTPLADELRAGVPAVLKRPEQRLLDVQELVVRNLALDAQFAITGKEDDRIIGRIDALEHGLCVSRLIYVVL